MAKTAYLIGIKGVGMTSLAVYLNQAGYEVSGSDTSEVFITDPILKKHNIEVIEEFSAKNLKGKKSELIIVSAAYGKDNPEVAEALKKKYNLKYYSEVVAEISKDKKIIAVSGIHGKTTTTALMSYMLEKSGLDPSFIIGSSEIPFFKSSAKVGEGDYFVLEADEYRISPDNNTSKFLDLTPEIAIITSIELDHPDIFGSEEEIYDAFYRFVCRAKRGGFIVLCVDYTKAKKLLGQIADRNFETYGFDNSAKWKILKSKETKSGMSFSLENAGQIHGPYEIKLDGNFNVLNATAVIVTAHKLGINDAQIQKNIKNFINVKRRFEKIAENSEIVIYDDYAHHPTAIKMSLDALKKKYTNRKIYCIFQPHTFSRTEKLQEEFSRSFNKVDKLIITDIFSSARESESKLTAVDLVEAIKQRNINVRHIQDPEQIIKYIKKSIKGPAVIVTMGAGDIYKLGKVLKTNLIK